MNNIGRRNEMKGIGWLRDRVENAPWESSVINKEMWLNRACWVVIVLAVLYFGPVICGIILR